MAQNDGAPRCTYTQEEVRNLPPEARRLLQRQATAYHEAGHAVMAYYNDWWVNHEGVEIDARQYCGMRRRFSENTLEANVMVSLAGWLSEYNWHGLGGLRMAEDIECLSSEIRNGWFDEEDRGDDSDVIKLLIEDSEDATDSDIWKTYSEYQAQTLEALKQPHVWTAVEAVAVALLEKGKLSQEDVEGVLTACGFFDTL